jgi:D-sedoheptulose 7-phosphate isomerase
MDSIIKNALKEHELLIGQLESLLPQIKKAAQASIDALKNGGKIMLCGNGGSAADSQHLAAELVGRFKKNRAPLAAIALTTDTSIITAVGNDFGFDSIFKKQVQALANKNDILIAISTSGNSQNIIEALKVAQEKNIFTIGLLGKDGGAIKKHVDLELIINAENTARIQELHILIGHIICEIIENETC